MVDLFPNIRAPNWTQRRLLTTVPAETFWWIVALLKLQACQKRAFKTFVQLQHWMMAASTEPLTS
jgi:hypothetical protein